MYSQSIYISTYTTPFSYFAAQAEPDADWYMPAYDDSLWPVDTARIGYGNEGREEVIVDDQTQSLYLRYKFNLQDPSSFKEMSLVADYDDGYIVYLNGKEIVRVNVDESIHRPAYNDLANRSHEPEFYQRSPVLGYYLDSTVLDTCLVTGTNTIAVHVLNDSIGGSDLHFRLYVYNITNDDNYRIYNFPYRYKRQFKLDSTELPIVIIESDEFGIPVKRIEVMAHMGIIDNGPGTYNKPTDSCNVYYGAAEIEVRGQSSADFPKRSYDFKLIDEEGNDSNVVILGMPEEHDWILQGPWADKSQFRNAMIYELSRRTGQWAARTRFCEVILNGQNVGLYTLMEKIKRDADRVNIARLNPDEISGNDLTGGYIVKYDKGSAGLQIVYPKESNLQPQQEAYIRGYFDEYYQVLRTNSGLDPETGYKKYIDEMTLIDHIVITELGKNCDAYAMSSYMYKDRNDRDPRIKYGPVWDFDLAFGNSPWQEGYRTDAWQFDYPSSNEYKIRRLFQDPGLVDQFEDRWFELRESFLHTDSLLAMIDSFVIRLAEPIQRNYMVWPVIDKLVFQYNWPYHVNTYEEEIDYIKSWLTERVDWMDENIGDIFYDVTIYPESIEDEVIDESVASLNVYPNPFTKEFILDLYLPFDGNLKIQLMNINGQLVDIISDFRMREGDYQLYWSDDMNLSAGIYLLDITLDGEALDRVKLVKAE